MRKLCLQCKPNNLILFVLIYFVFFSLSMFFTCDDYAWYYVHEMDTLSEYINPNGRYFTNFITYIIVSYPIIRTIIYSLVLTLYICIVTRLTSFTNNFSIKELVIVSSLFFAIPGNIFSQTINWLSGFTNYTFAVVFVLIYIYYILQIVFNNYTPSIKLSILSLVLGICGGLCNELLTIYNIFFAVFSIIIIYKFRKRVYSCNLVFLISSVVSAVIMFSNSAYSSIAADNDVLGQRRFEVSFSDIYFRLITNLLESYTKPFVLIHIFISVGLFIIHFKSEKNFKYSKLCLFITFVFASYSFFTTYIHNFESLNPSYRFKSIETAFTFVYIISVFYLAVKYLDVKKKTSVIIYITSSLFLTIPFTILNPVTARCFYLSYVFWTLSAAVIVFDAISRIKSEETERIFKYLSVFPAFAASVILICNFMNKYYDKLRYEYLVQQISEDATVVNLIKLPYSEYAIDDAEDTPLTSEMFQNGITYFELILKYYGIDNIDVDDINLNLIDVYSYNQIK